MGMQEKMHGAGYRRTVSSGVVFGGGSPSVERARRMSHLNSILLGLIEEEMELSFRSQNCLNTAGIKLIGQLVQKSASELLDLKSFGRNSLREIERALGEMRLTLEMPLNFAPWNGEGHGDELIRILSLQCAGGGFHAGADDAAALGIDIKEAGQDGTGPGRSQQREEQNILLTQRLMNVIETKYLGDMPFLADCVKLHRSWLKRKSQTS